MTSEHVKNQPAGQTMIRLDDLRWQHRIILVFGDEDTDYENLQKRFQAQQVDIDERNIRFFLIGEHILSNGPETFDQQYVQELKNRYKSDQDNMTVVLIGKDGGEKYRQTYLDLEEIYREIDAMPMRIQEMRRQKERQEKMLIDFSNADKRGQWRIINDSVMGGISQSEIFLSDQGTAIFQGTVSLENNGGFASTRTIPRSYNIDDYSGLAMRVKGDGQKYQVRLRVDNRFDGISYRHHITTEPGTWMTIRIPFRDFVPVFRGRILNDVPPISPEQIQQIGFLISDKQVGEFRLEIKWIQAYK